MGKRADARVRAPLAPEELMRPVGGSFSTVLGRLAHLYGAEWVWLERWRGRSPGALPASQEAPSFDALREKWRKVEQTAFVAGVTARMTEVLTCVNFAGRQRVIRSASCSSTR